MKQRALNIYKAIYKSRHPEDQRVPKKPNLTTEGLAKELSSVFESLGISLADATRGFERLQEAARLHQAELARERFIAAYGNLGQIADLYNLDYSGLEARIAPSIGYENRTGRQAFGGLLSERHGFQQTFSTLSRRDPARVVQARAEDNNVFPSYIDSEVGSPTTLQRAMRQAAEEMIESFILDSVPNFVGYDAGGFDRESWQRLRDEERMALLGPELRPTRHVPMEPVEPEPRPRDIRPVRYQHPDANIRGFRRGR